MVPQEPGVSSSSWGWRSADTPQAEELPILGRIQRPRVEGIGKAPLNPQEPGCLSAPRGGEECYQ